MAFNNIRAPELNVVDDSVDQTSAVVSVTLPATEPTGGWAAVSLTVCAKNNGTDCPDQQGACSLTAGSAVALCYLEGLEPDTEYVAQVRLVADGGLRWG